MYKQFFFRTSFRIRASQMKFLGRTEYFQIVQKIKIVVSFILNADFCFDKTTLIKVLHLL